MLFELQDVRYREILDLPELQLDTGLTVLLGTSGSGKTTIFKLLNKLISPTSGHIRYLGQDLSQLDSVTHRRSVMMLTQNPVLFEGTIRDNLTIGFGFQNRPVPTDDLMQTMLAQVQLNKSLAEPILNLSGGEKQRVALARVFLLEPAVYLLDEPSSALDDATEDAVIGLVADQTRLTGRSTIMVTHSKAVAAKYADTVIELSAGRVIRSGGQHV